MNNIAGVYIRLKLYIEACPIQTKPWNENQLRSFPYQCRYCSSIAGQFFRRGRVSHKGGYHRTLRISWLSLTLPCSARSKETMTGHMKTTLIYHKCGMLTVVSVLPESWRGRDEMQKQPGFTGKSSLSRAQAHQPGSLQING